MFFLTDLVPESAVENAPTMLDNILTLSLVAALVLVIVIAVIRKAVANKKASAAPATPVEEAPAAPAPTAPGSAGGIKLYNTEPKVAAMVMAIVADKLQKPLNELRFISIKEVE